MRGVGGTVVTSNYFPVNVTCQIDGFRSVDTKYLKCIFKKKNEEVKSRMYFNSDGQLRYYNEYNICDGRRLEIDRSFVPKNNCESNTCYKLMSKINAFL